MNRGSGSSGSGGGEGGGSGARVEPRARSSARCVLFRSLLQSWRGVGEGRDQQREVAITLQLDGGGVSDGRRRLSVRACDGLELRGTHAAVSCPWPALPATAALHVALREHPLYIERWQLTLRVPPTNGRVDGGARAATAVRADDEMVVDLWRLVGRGASGTASAASASAPTPGGEMVRALVERLTTLRAERDRHVATNNALKERLSERESQLEARAETLRRETLCELRDFLPLLVAKQRRLEELEREAVEKNLHEAVSAASAASASDDELEEDTQREAAEPKADVSMCA